VREVADLGEPPPYREFFERWQADLLAVGARCFEATTRTRMVVGLGAEAVLETSIALHRTYGVPHIPGSALKGLAAHYADQHLEDPAWRKGGKAHSIAFGSTSNAGYVAFFDALPLPRQHRLHPDVMTVHHPGYYSGKKRGDDFEPPADWDSPNPVPFLSATGRFLVALSGQDAWVDRVFDILRLALDYGGVGAKTSSGYGRLELQVSARHPRSPVETVDAATETLLAQVRAMAPHRVRAEIDPIVRRWQALTGRGRQQVAAAIFDLLERAGVLRDRKWRESRQWIQEMDESRSGDHPT
jgi:CRISPR-associated protein Cmr6